MANYLPIIWSFNNTIFKKIKYLSTTSWENRDGILKANLDDLEDGDDDENIKRKLP